MNRSTKHLAPCLSRCKLHRGESGGIGQNRLTITTRPDRALDRDCSRYEECLAEVLALDTLATSVCRSGCLRYRPVELHATDCERRET